MCLIVSYYLTPSRSYCHTCAYINCKLRYYLRIIYKHLPILML